MKYEKPQIAKLSPALSAIQGQLVKPGNTIQDSPRAHTVGAYEADE
jgi:hypothetical protein